MQKDVFKIANLTCTAWQSTETIRVGLIPVSGKVISPISTGEHSCSNDCFSYLIWAASTGPQWVGGGEGHEGWFEVLEGREKVSLSSQLLLPPVNDLGFAKILPFAL